MRSSYRGSIALTTAALCAAACDSTGPTEPPAVTPSFASGATVVRTQTLSFLAHLDGERGLLSIHAPSNLCSDGDINVNDLQFVVTPSAVEQFVARLSSSAEQVAVYSAASFADAGMVGTAETAGFGGIVDVGQFCDFLEGPTLVAEGTVRRISNFSNASFAARWTGALTTTGGATTQLTEVYQLRADALDPNNPDLWVVDVSSILLR